MINIPLTQKSLMGICIALCALIAITLLFSIWEWRHDWVLAHLEPPTPTPRPDESANLIAALPGQHLFGQALTTEMPLSSLQLRVTGISKVEDGENAQLSRAYISFSGQPSKIYKIGDNITDGVKVYAITNDAVIVEHQGRLEKIPLPREKLEFKPKPSKGIDQ